MKALIWEGDGSLCIGLLKDDLIYILLEKDRQKQTELFRQIYDEISKISFR